MLDEFIKSNRDEIIAGTMALATARCTKQRDGMASGIPLFLDQLVERLRHDKPSTGDLAASAAIHGNDMLRHGFTVAQVVQGYGDVCQIITSLAIQCNASITTDEFRTLNRCLDTATAKAVTEYERQRDRTASDQETERLGFLAHELRNKLNSAMMSFDILKRGSVGIGGSTGAILGRSLSGLRDLIDRTLMEVRLESGVSHRERIRVWKFIEEVEVVAAFEANKRGLLLTVTCADDEAVVDIDHHILTSAVGNLLQNALKFTHDGGHVKLEAHASADRILIDIEDQCGGLPSGDAEALFRNFEQRSADRTGLGLGLAISRRGVEANGGELDVRDLPGRGCVFTVDLPRAAAADAR